jgi:hypothetical protein
MWRVVPGECQGSARGVPGETKLGTSRVSGDLDDFKIRYRELCREQPLRNCKPRWTNKKKGSPRPPFFFMMNRPLSHSHSG